MIPARYCAQIASDEGALDAMAVELPLRDIHLPEPVSWWPPAPGWWVLTVILLLLPFLIRWLWRRRPQAPHHRRLYHRAAAELDRLERDCGDDPAAALRRLSALLRRVAISARPRTDVAALTGLRWLHFLDQWVDGPRFSDGPGAILAAGPYQDTVRADIPALLALCRRWLAGICAPAPGGAP